MSSSYPQILQSTALFSAVSGLGIALRIVRIKVIAVLLGPAGIGLLGLYQALVISASQFAGMGTDVSAVRQIAAVRGKGDKAALGAVIRALLLAMALLGVLGVLVVYLLRTPIASRVLGDVGQASAVGWLAVAVGLTVVGAQLMAMLRGFRKIGDQVRAGAISAVLSTVMSVALILWLGVQGILWLVVLTPVLGILVALRYTRPILASHAAMHGTSTGTQFIGMVKLGFFVMLAGSLLQWGILGLLSKLANDYDLVTVGIFQAAWAVSFVYLGFILDAMGADYFPRLSEALEDDQDVVRLMNEQMHAALVLGAPLLIAMMAFAPWLVNLIYSSEFESAAPAIRWMIFGNLVKLVGWPLGFIVVAKGRSKLFLLTQAEWITVFLVFALIGMNWMGIEGIGMAFTAAFVVHIFVVWSLARYLCGFRFARSNLYIAGAVGVTCAALLVASTYSEALVLALGGGMLVLSALFMYRELGKMLGKSPLDAIRMKLGV